MKLPQGSRHDTKHTNCTVAASGSLNGKKIKMLKLDITFLSLTSSLLLFFPFSFHFSLPLSWGNSRWRLELGEALKLLEL